MTVDKEAMNKRLRGALELLDQARATGHYAIRSQMMLALYDEPELMPRNEWFKLLGREWPQLVTIEWRERYVRIFQSASRAEKDLMMTATERDVLAALPNLVQVYRGCDGRARKGLHWGTTPDHPRRFIEELVHSDGGRDFGVVFLSGFARKEHIVAVKIFQSCIEVVATYVTVVNEQRVPYAGPRKEASA